MLHDAMITRPDLSPLLPTFENDGRPSPPPAYTQYTFVCVLSFEASHTDPVNCPPDGVKLTEIDVQGSAGLRLPRALSMTAKSALHFRRFHDTVPRDTTTHDVRDNDAGRQNARNVSLLPSRIDTMPAWFFAAGGISFVNRWLRAHSSSSSSFFNVEGM